MPPKKGSTKAKPQALPEIQKPSKELNITPQPIKSKYLAMYNEYFCSTNIPGFFNANEAYLRKIGALQKHRINKYEVRIEKKTDWTDKPIVFKHLSKFKRLQKVSFYMGQKVIFAASQAPQQDEILDGFRKITRRLPHLSSVEFIYSNELQQIRTFRQLGRLNHITLGINITDLTKPKNEGGLIQLLSRDFKHHRFNSARLICYGNPGAATKAKKASKGKPKGKKSADPELGPIDYLSPEFNHLTLLQKLSLDFKDSKTFTAFKPLLLAETFSQLKRLSIQVPDHGFSIESKTENILEPALSLVEILFGKGSKKATNTKAPKPEITLTGCENALKSHAQIISALGKVVSIAITISKSKETEFAEMFSHLKDLKSLSLIYSPIADWQILEVCKGISNINALTDLEVYLKNYKFTKESVHEIHSSILQHSSTLTKLCLGFQDVNQINDTTAVMNSVLQIQNLTIFKLYIGYVGSYKKVLQPLRDLAQLKRLTELEVGGFFNQHDLSEVGMEFSKVLCNLNGLRRLGLKTVWHYNMWDGGRKEDFTDVIKELPMLRRLKSLVVDFDNSTWHLKKPK